MPYVSCDLQAKSRTVTCSPPPHALFKSHTFKPVSTTLESYIVHIHNMNCLFLLSLNFKWPVLSLKFSNGPAVLIYCLCVRNIFWLARSFNPLEDQLECSGGRAKIMFYWKSVTWLIISVVLPIILTSTRVYVHLC